MSGRCVRCSKPLEASFVEWGTPGRLYCWDCYLGFELALGAWTGASDRTTRTAAKKRKKERGDNA